MVVDVLNTFIKNKACNANVTKKNTLHLRCERCIIIMVITNE